jgi:hypothetical protein
MISQNLCDEEVRDRVPQWATSPPHSPLVKHESSESGNVLTGKSNQACQSLSKGLIRLTCTCYV